MMLSKVKEAEASAKNLFSKGVASPRAARAAAAATQRVPTAAAKQGSGTRNVMNSNSGNRPRKIAPQQTRPPRPNSGRRLQPSQSPAKVPGRAQHTQQVQQKMIDVSAERNKQQKQIQVQDDSDISATRSSKMDLLSLIQNKYWGDVVERIKTYPLEAQRCHYISLGGIGSDAATLSRVLPLHLMATLQPPSSVLQAMIDANSSAASAKDSVSGKLPLHLACIHGASLNCLKLLIFVYRDGARTLDAAGRLPLHYICQRGSAEEVSLLLRTAPSGAFIKDKNGMNAISLARKSHNPHLKEITAAMKKYRVRALNVNANATRINRSKLLKSHISGATKKTTMEQALHRCDVTVLSNDDIISDEVLIPGGKGTVVEETALIPAVSEEVVVNETERTCISSMDDDVVHYVVTLDDGSIEPGDDEEIELDDLLQKLDSDRSLLSRSQEAIQNIDLDIAKSNGTLAGLQIKREELKKCAASKQHIIDGSKRNIVAKKKLILELMEEVEREEKVMNNAVTEGREATLKLEACQSEVEEEEAKKSTLERERERLNREYQEHSSRTLERDVRLEELLSNKLPDNLK